MGGSPHLSQTPHANVEQPLNISVDNRWRAGNLCTLSTWLLGSSGLETNPTLEATLRAVDLQQGLGVCVWNWYHFGIVASLHEPSGSSCAGSFCHNCSHLSSFSFFFTLKVINDDAFRINFHPSSSWQPLCLCYLGQSKEIKKGISEVLSSVLTWKKKSKAAPKGARAT